MSELTTPRRRRRRTDADRSAAAILQAAKEILAAEPQASLEDIAAAAGVSRQTVYAHFKSRESLIAAVVDAIAAEAAAEMDAARLAEGPAADALLRLLDASWRSFQRYPLLLSIAAAAADTDADADDSRHVAVFDHLGQLLTRGQQSGEFARDLPTPWLATAIVTLGHTAGEAVGAGQLKLPEAVEALAKAVLRICGVNPQAIDDLVARHALAITDR